ncbi:MAG: ABC transporter ATP-binding protein/permease [Erysipelotrichaceae bacterium]|jgi:ATP-binding cassette subfamily B protein|nr:ABC transporter ATP-binding protein/permease [Erysipelotrichaceae bacterium]
MKTILHYLGRHKWRMTFGLTMKFVGTVLELVLPYLLSYVIDTIIPQGQLNLIFLAGGLMAFCAVLAYVTSVWANRIASKVAVLTTQEIRSDLFERILTLSNRQIDGFGISSLQTRMTADSYAINNFINMMQRIGIRAPILLLGGITVTMLMDPVLSATLVCAMVVIGSSIFSITRRGLPIYSLIQKKLDKMVRVIRENITGIRVIKSLSKTEYEQSRFDEANQDVTASEKKAARIMALTNPLVNLFLNIGLVAVIYIGAVRVQENLTQAGKIIAFLSYFSIILMSLMAINRIFINAMQATASAKRIAEVLATADDVEISYFETVPSDYHIEFADVSFSYFGESNDIEHISFQLKKGETLGIIGATGSGKSTIIRLLMRQYDTDQGKILINGKNVLSYQPKDLHEMFGVVFQNDTLFSKTIFENIDFGRGLGQKAVEHGARVAQAAEFIESLPERYQHKLTGRATNLSGGQRQRLLIARALAKKPQILVLDDASSALDYQTDANLRKALREEYQQTTTIIIAQRISSLMSADHILVLEDGKILGYGKHDELLASCPLYRTISESQLGGVVA